MSNWIKCRQCLMREKQGLSTNQEGFYLTEEVDKNTGNTYKVMKECECHKRWRMNELLNYKCKQSNTVTDLTFDSYVGEQSIEDINALKSIVNNPKKYLTKQNIYIYGTNGTQKTSMVQVLGKELLRTNSVQYILMNDLLSNLIGNYNDTDNSKLLFAEHCKDVDFLIIDECFDKTKVTIYQSGYQIPYLDSFLRERYDVRKKPTIFVSNIAPSGIDIEKYGASIKNFIERTTLNATLEFKDVYLDLISKPDRLSLFKNNA